MGLNLILYASTRESEALKSAKRTLKIKQRLKKTLEIFLSTTVQQKSGLRKKSKEKSRYASVSNERLSYRRLKHSKE